MDLRWAYGSDQRLREENQDTFGVFRFGDVVVAVVCDGMGGHPGGRDASQIAVRTVHDTMAALDPTTPLRERLIEAVQRANATIFKVGRHTRRFGMGTTLVAAAVEGTQVQVAHVGDSRAYLLSDAGLKPLTRDHSIVNLLIDAELLPRSGAESHPDSHVLARSVGVDAQVEVEVLPSFELHIGERLVLSSDGVHGVLREPGLSALTIATVENVVDEALAAVRAQNGDDNATLVALGLAPTSPPSAVTAPPDVPIALLAAKTVPSDAAPTEASPERRLLPPQPIVAIPPTPMPPELRRSGPALRPPSPTSAPAPQAPTAPATPRLPWVLLAITVTAATAWWWIQAR